MIVAASVAFGAGAVQLLHAATEPYAITVSEIKVTDMDGYSADSARSKGIGT
jgi:hypothetical protein